MAWWTGQPVYGSNPVSKFIRENFAYLKTYVDYIVNSGVTTTDLAAVHASPPTLAAVVNITVNTTIGDTDVGLGGGYNISAGVVLTVDGAFSAPITQIFFGTGTVHFIAGSVLEVYPEWWGAYTDNTHVAETSAALLAAMVAAEHIGVVRLSAGIYRTVGDLGTTYPCWIKGNGVAHSYLYIDPSVDVTHDIITFRPDAGDEIKGYGCCDFTITGGSATIGRHGIYLDGTNGLNRSTIERVNIDPMGNYAIRNHGSFSSSIQNCHVAGIELNVGTDNLNVLNNTITGNFWGVYVDCIAGSNMCNIQNNVIVSKLGMVYVKNSGSLTISDNQYETQSATTDAYSSAIVLEGSALQIFNTLIWGNNFNVSPTYMVSSITLVNTVGVSIQGNTFSGGTAYPASQIIVIGATNYGTIIDKNYYYGNQIGVNAYNASAIMGAVYDALYNPLGRVVDGGVGTCGVWKLFTSFPIDITREPNAEEFSFMKDVTDKRVWLKGGLTVANPVAGKVLGALPVLFRPEQNYTLVPAVAKDAGGVFAPIAIKIDIAGGVYLEAIPAGFTITEVYFNGVSFEHTYH